MKNILIVAVVVMAISAGGAYYIWSGSSWQKVDNSDDQKMMADDEMMNEDMMDDVVENGDSTMPVEDDSTPGSMMDGGEGMMAGSVKEFTVVATPFKFDIAEIKVKKGDKVKVVFKNDKGTHDWVIDEFNIRTKVLEAGQTDTVEFIADKSGSFEYYCSVNNHRQMGMVGKFIVVEE